MREVGEDPTLKALPAYILHATSLNDCILILGCPKLVQLPPRQIYETWVPMGWESLQKFMSSQTLLPLANDEKKVGQIALKGY